MRFRTKILLTVALALGSFAPSWAGVKVSVSPSTTYQTVGGFGGSIVYYQDWLTNSPLKSAIYDTLFTGLGINCVRFGNWAQDTDADLSKDVEIYNEAKKRIGPDMVTVLASWSAPASLKANNSINGSNDDGKASLKKADGKFVYDDFGNWWKAALLKYRKEGISPDYISIQNEPDCDNSTYATMVLKPKATDDVAAYGEALKAVHEKIQTVDNPPRFLGADNLGIGWNQSQNYIDALDSTLLDGYAFHYYHSGYTTYQDETRYNHPDEFVDAMKGLATDLPDKPLWMAENSSLRDRQKLDGLYTAWFIANAFNYNRVSYYLHWNLFWGDQEDGCLNIDTLKNTFTVQTDYHGLRHFSKFVKPGWKVLESSTTDGNITSCAFGSQEADAYTVVMVYHAEDGVGTQTEAKYVHLSIPLEGNWVSRVIMTVPDSDMWSKECGALTGDSVLMPLNSIVTVTYQKRQPATYIYAQKVDMLWSTAGNWSSSVVPLSFDTVIIRSGECKTFALSHSAPLTVEAGGTFRLSSGNDTLGNVQMNGGLLKVYTSNPEFDLLASALQVNATSTFQVGSKDSTVFGLSVPVSGTFDLIKTKSGILDLRADNSAYSGIWRVAEGSLQLSVGNALGSSGVNLYSGTFLKVKTNNSTSTLNAISGSTIELTGGNLSVKKALLGGVSLSEGAYTAADYPDYLTGSDTLFVNPVYPILVKQGAGSSRQTVKVDSSIVSFNYAWKNADSVMVSWDPYQPEGIEVVVSVADSQVTFSGIPTSVGNFLFKVYSFSSSDSVVTKSGSITVIDTTNKHSSLEDLASIPSLFVTCQPGGYLLLSSASISSPAPVLWNIYSLSGTLYLSGNGWLQKSEDFRIDASSLPKGVCLLQVNGADGKRFFKVLLE